MIIDAHQHFWMLGIPPNPQMRTIIGGWWSREFDYRWLDAPEMAPIRKDRMPADLRPLMAAAGVDRSIVVQTQHNFFENLWMLDDVAEYNQSIAGVVGWVDLQSDQCEIEVKLFKTSPKFVGVRHVAQDEPDDDWLVRPEVMSGLGVLEAHEIPFDVLIYVKHLKHVPTLARAFPNLRMVINHLAKPRIKDHATEDWLPGFRDAAAFPNVFCKLSGMVTEADWLRWTVDDLRPYVQTALDLFGPERLMYGSDWPVCELAGSYSQVKNALGEALGPISDSERTKIFGGTAISFYNLAKNLSE
jgi:L-fuconolactonase